MANKIGLRPQVLRPAAAPRDTFVMPNAGAGLGQLADALSQVSPALSRFGAVTAQERGEKEKLEGENAAREFVTAHKTYKDAIDAGLITKQHSPFYRMGAYETFGRASAFRYQDDFRIALGSSPVAESTSPDDYDKFEGEFRTKWMQKELGEKVDPFMQAAFGRQADNLINGDRSNFAANAAKKLEGQISEAFQAEVHSIVKLGYEGHADPENVLEHIQLAMDRQIAGHMPKRIVNENVAEAIVSAARRMNDISVLDLMDKIRVGSGFMSGTGYGSKLREDAENQIATVNQARLSQESARAKAEREAAVDAVTSEFITALQADPTINVEPFIARAVAAGDPEKATTYIKMQESFVDREYMDVPQVKQRLFIGVHTGYTNMSRLDNALASKAITFATYSQLADDVRSRDKEAASGGGAGKTALDDDYLRDLQRRVRGAFVAEMGESTPQERLRADQAVTDATERYLRERKRAGDKATDESINQWIGNEVKVQFARHSDSGKVDDAIAEGIIGPLAGPKRVNVEKELAAPREVIERIVMDNADGKLSPASISVLRSLRVPPAKVQEFIDSQKKLLNP
jgi:hypothetical protein